MNKIENLQNALVCTIMIAVVAIMIGLWGAEVCPTSRIYLRDGSVVQLGEREYKVVHPHGVAPTWGDGGLNTPIFQEVFWGDNCMAVVVPHMRPSSDGRIYVEIYAFSVPGHLRR